MSVGFAQVGIGTTDPDASSALDITSTTSGLLIPRMTNNEKLNISSPATGLLVYDTDNSCLSQNVGTASSPDWVCLTQAATRFFYLPSMNIDVSSTGTGRTVDLYNEYKSQFSSPLVSSSGASGSIPYFGATELEYYVTAYDTSVLENLSIDANGVMTYDVIDSASECSFINVVLVIK
ncbi:hypothetical protein NBRC110019_26840 [Neptunitalea chrysea]|uniref:Uncharacterized protein n=2 Tax=Neptunitalea chrysea TaxID=1647581 RepID=A0A9W6B6R4_9FLAO|nr:hypothetical protein NBRC110019_26840 [Neptunitalea chrysea]